MWRVELFGEVRVVGHGQSITRFESKRVAALLAYLVLNSKTRHPREVLADRIWPDASLDAGRNRLKQALASLRRQLEPPPVTPGSVLDADRFAIGINPESFVSDVHEFKQLVRLGKLDEARGLYRGELLAGFYDEWIEDFRIDLDSYVLELEGGVSPSSEPTAPSPEFRKSIPAAVSSFIGREAEMEAIQTALTSGRWLTVTGFGGLGKTRITRQIGRTWDGDAFFVPLAFAQNAKQIPGAILSALGLDGAQVQDPIQALSEATAGRSTLLILDNLEQIPAAETASVLTQILESSTQVKLLCSSRLPIKASAEYEVRLDPLPLPPETSSPADLADNASVRLFVDRARQIRPDFQVTAGNAQSIARLCRRLDGSPLAIEICAAWAKMGAGALLQRLEAGEELPVRKGEVGNPHESLSRVLETTCDLLSEDARTLLDEVCAFRGGWDWPLLQALSPGSASVAALTELLDASIVRSDERMGESRFHVLESMRQAGDRRTSSENREHRSQRFLDLFSDVAARSRRCGKDDRFDLDDQISWIAFLDRNWTNVRHAIELAAKRDPACAAKLAWDTEWYWAFYQADPEVLRSLSDLNSPVANLLTTTHLGAKLPESDLFARYDSVRHAEPTLTSETLLRKAKLRILRQNMNGVRELASAAHTLFDQEGELLGLGQSEHILANCAIQDGERGETEERLDSAHIHFERAGSKIDLGAVAYTRCRALYMRGDYEAALPQLYRCRDAVRDLRHMRTSGRTANLFGVVLGLLEDDARARVYYFLSLVAATRNFDVRGTHMPLWNLGLSLGREHRYSEAVPMMGRAMRVWEDFFKTRLDEEESTLYSDFQTAAQAQLGLVDFSELLARGESHSLGEALAFARSAISDDLDRHRGEAVSFFEPEFNPLEISLR